MFRGLFFVVMLGIVLPLKADLSRELESLQQHLVALENALQPSIIEPSLGLNVKKFNIELSFPPINSLQFENQDLLQYSKSIEEAYNQLLVEMKFIIEKMPLFINFLNKNNDPNAISPDFNEIVGSINKMVLDQNDFKNALAQIGQIQEIKASDAHELKKYLNSIFDNLNNFYQKYIVKVFDYIDENLGNKKFAFDDKIATARDHYGKAIYSAPAINEIKKHQYGSEYLLDTLSEIIGDLEKKAQLLAEIKEGPFQDVTNDALRQALEEIHFNYDILETELNELKNLLEGFKNDLLKDTSAGDYRKTVIEDFVKVYRGVQKIKEIIKELNKKVSVLNALEKIPQNAEDAAFVHPVIEKIIIMYSEIYNFVNDFYRNNENMNLMRAIEKVEFGGNKNTLSQHFYNHVWQEVRILAPAGLLVGELGVMKRNWENTADIKK